MYLEPELTHTICKSCRLRGAGGDTEHLLEAAAHLYQLQARYDLTLAILLRLKRPSVFEFIRSHHLLPMLKGSSIPQLISIDSAPAIQLLVDCHEEVPPQVFVPALQVHHLLRFVIDFQSYFGLPFRRILGCNSCHTDNALESARMLRESDA